MNLRQLSLSTAALLCAGAAQASVLLELAGGYLKNQGDTRITAGSGVLVLVASTSDNTFTELTSTSSLVVGTAVATGSDDLVIYRSTIGGDGNSSGTDDAGEFRQAISVVYENGLAAGQALRLYWFPTLNAAKTQPGTGVRYGVYRAAITNVDGTTDADGSAPWFLPADGTSGHPLLFLTSDAGSAVNTGTSGAAYGQTEFVTEGTAVPNTTPIAKDDTIQLTTTSALDLLSNDSDPDGDTLTITTVTQPGTGTAVLSSGVVTYTPGSTFTGRDSFTYTVSDGQGGSATATVTIIHPFLAFRGAYSAILSLNGTKAGTATATLTAKGGVTGKLVLNGKSYTLRGTAMADGTFTQTIANAGLTITLTFAPDADGVGTLSASVASSAGTYTSDPTAAFAGSALVSAPAGRYHCVLPGGTQATEPFGTGWLTLVLTSKGVLRGAGRLPDNTKTSFSTRLRLDSTATFSATLYSEPKGSLSGTFTFKDSTDTDVTGMFSQIKPARTSNKGLFATGFTLDGSLAGSRYTLTASGTSLTFANPLSPLAEVIFSEGDLAADLSQVLTFPASGKATAVTPITVPLALKITRSTGLFSGTFTPAGGSRTSCTGVVLRKTNEAVGVFSGSTQTGTVTITPQ